MAKKQGKMAVIRATFPQLAAAKMYQEGRGSAGNSATAIGRAVRDVFAKVKRHHITMVQATITISAAGEGSAAAGGE
jgi:hypothetical protein